MDNLSKIYKGDVSSWKHWLELKEEGYNGVSGNFSCKCQGLKSLEHSPLYVGGHFFVSKNELTSLEFCPRTVGGGFFCDFNQVSSLEFFPTNLSGRLDCSYNKIKSLEFLPKVMNESLYCQVNRITSLEKCPEIINGVFNFSENKLKDIDSDGFPRKIKGNIYCSYNSKEINKYNKKSGEEVIEILIQEKENKEIRLLFDGVSTENKKALKL